MSGHLKALGIKTMTVVIFSAILTPMFTDLPVSAGIVTGLALSAISYALIDLQIMPSAGNAVATATDVATAAMVYWFGVMLAGGSGLSIWELLFFSVLVGISEWFFHIYLTRFVLREGNRLGK